MNQETIENKLNSVTGKSFEKTLDPELVFSTKSTVIGISHNNHWENLSNDLKNKILRQSGYKCFFCGFKSSINQIHNISDNHEDNREENLVVICHICHAWKHLGELSNTEAVISFISSITPQHIVHLQRIALSAVNQNEDKKLSADALKILNWLASRKVYVEKVLNTSKPNDFAKAISRTRGNIELNDFSFTFKGLSLVLNYKNITDSSKKWLNDMQYKPRDWLQVYSDINKMIVG